MSDLRFQRVSEISAPVESLRQWHFQPGAFERLTPPWERARVLSPAAPLADGSVARIEVAIGPFWRRWVAVHEITPWGFIDRQVEGPFARWEHHHRFESVGENRCRLTDTIDYRLPVGWLGNLVARRWIERKLDRLFDHRHAVTRAALEG